MNVSEQGSRNVRLWHFGRKESLSVDGRVNNRGKAPTPIIISVEFTVCSVWVDCIFCKEIMRPHLRLVVANL